MSHQGLLPPSISYFFFMASSSAASLRHRLEEIAAETALLHSKIAESAAARCVVVEQLKLVIFPIQTLPMELTSEIFLCCHRGDTISIAETPQRTMPFVLAAVCQRWRAIAIQLHELWSTLSIKVIYGNRIERAKEILRLCLERAGPHRDLDISIEQDIGLKELFPLLLPTASRWTQCGVYIAASILDRIRGKVNRLRSVTLCMDFDTWETGGQRQVLAFEDAPLLREAELTDVDAYLVSLPWAQLTSLRLGCQGSMESQACFEMLRETPLLETLYFEIPEHSTLDHTPRSELRFDRLRTLTFEWSAGRRHPIALTFIHLFDVPALVNLTTELDDHEKRTGPAIIKMLNRSQCSLNIRSLTLKTNGKRMSQDIANIVKLIPVLAKLTVTQIAWEEVPALVTAVKLGHASAEIGELYLETVAVAVPYRHLESLISARTRAPESSGGGRTSKEASGLRRLEFCIPNSRYPASQEVSLWTLAAVETLKSIAASTHGPKINITGLGNSFVIKSDSRPPPRIYTLCD
ncbi:hypothetical protein C8F01DRAFT_1232412 [Mycena amicta]|nr:hypothetical protein C8F01DRAFT_1232412 [Mycena amicta]